MNDATYWDWYANVVYRLEELAEVTTSDAQGMLDAREADVSNCWAQGMDEEETAKFINDNKFIPL